MGISLNTTESLTAIHSFVDISQLLYSFQISILENLHKLIAFGFQSKIINQMLKLLLAFQINFEYLRAYH